jgi:hypothetical protein
MAARRLLIVMLVLLGISTLAAALIPPQSLREGTTGSTATEETETTAPDTVPKGEALGFDFTVEKDKIAVLRAEVGDQLSIKVRCKCTDLVEIPKLGRLDPVTPGSPVTFDVLAREKGSYGIRLVEADRVVARIEVEAAAKSRAPAAPDRP